MKSFLPVVWNNLRHRELPSSITTGSISAAGRKVYPLPYKPCGARHGCSLHAQVTIVKHKGKRKTIEKKNTNTNKSILSFNLNCFLEVPA